MAEVSHHPLIRARGRRKQIEDARTRLTDKKAHVTSPVKTSPSTTEKVGLAIPVGLTAAAIGAGAIAQHQSVNQHVPPPTPPAIEHIIDRETLVPPIDRPALKPAEVKEEKRIVRPSVELLTKNRSEQEGAEELIAQQKPRIEGIAIDKATNQPSTTFQQQLDHGKIIDREIEKYPSLDKETTRAVLLTEGRFGSSLEPDTAKRMGLRVDETVDERENPSRYVEGMVKYLAEQYDFWGNMSYAVVAFNCGPGGFAEMAYGHARAHGVSLPVPSNGNIREDSNPFRDYLIDHDVSVYQLIIDPSVDFYRTQISEIYAPRVAAAMDFRETWANRLIIPQHEASYPPKERTDGAQV